MLELLNGVSPVWWFVAALVLGCLELLTATTYLYWPALAALAVSGILFVYPDLTGNHQLAIFAISSIVLSVAAARLWRGRVGRVGLNEPAKRAIGQVAEIVEFSGIHGKVTVGGVRWHARSETELDLAPGSSVRVTGSEGSTLLIEAVDGR